MSENLRIRVGQVVTGSLFNEPMRVETVRADGGQAWVVGDVLKWSDVVPQRKLTGRLVNVECLGANARLEVKDRQGTSIRLLLKNVSESGLACGTQKPERNVSLSYAAQADDRSRTAGLITSIKLQ